VSHDAAASDREPNLERKYTDCTTGNRKTMILKCIYLLIKTIEKRFNLIVLGLSCKVCFSDFGQPITILRFGDFAISLITKIRPISSLYVFLRNTTYKML
jgi:hypothetical protein